MCQERPPKNITAKYLVDGLAGTNKSRRNTGGKRTKERHPGKGILSKPKRTSSPPACAYTRQMQSD